jgi:hypothetical protein
VTPRVTHIYKERDDACRAIGRYVVKFSELVRMMRSIASEYVATDAAVDTDLVSMLLGEAAAQQIANAFFGLCRTVGGLEEDEEAVSRVLRKRVDDSIRTRNDIAHGDWQVAETSYGLPPRLLRIVPMRGEGPFRTQELSAADVDALSDELEALTGLIQDFGRLALKLKVLDYSRGLVGLADQIVNPGEYRGKYRVSDVLTATSGRDGRRVLRNGPYAHVVFGGLDSKLAVMGYADPPEPESGPDQTAPR